MNWETKLTEISEQGMSYPKEIDISFLFETSPYKDEDSVYQEKFIPSKKLESMREDSTPFEKKFGNNKYVTSFYSLSKDSLLVVPIPKKGKNYKSLKEFLDNASKTQKKAFFRHLVKKIREMKKLHQTIWISTSGLGVGYLHFRIDTYPKYYETKKFKNTS